jgi:hypothetical protein
MSDCNEDSSSQLKCILLVPRHNDALDSLKDRDRVLNNASQGWMAGVYLFQYHKHPSDIETASRVNAFSIVDG